MQLTYSMDQEDSLDFADAVDFDITPVSTPARSDSTSNSTQDSKSGQSGEFISGMEANI